MIIWKKVKPTFPLAHAIWITTPGGHAGDPGTSLHIDVWQPESWARSIWLCDSFPSSSWCIGTGSAAFSQMTTVLQWRSLAMLLWSVDFPGPMLVITALQGDEWLSWLPLRTLLLGSCTVSLPLLSAQEHHPSPGGIASTRCKLIEGLCSHRWKEKQGPLKESRHWKIAELQWPKSIRKVGNSLWASADRAQLG